MAHLAENKRLLPLLVLAASATTSCDTPAESCRHWYYKHDFYKRDACSKGCDENADVFSCEKASTGMVLGHDGPADLDGALRYSRKACALDPRACSSVPFHECVADPTLCEQRCTQGAAEACTWHARAMMVGNYRAPIDIAKSRVFLRRACELDATTCKEGLDAACRGNANGCLDACEKGQAESCYWMSVLFQIGSESILRDAEKSRTFLERACRLDATLVARCADPTGAKPPAEEPLRERP